MAGVRALSELPKAELHIHLEGAVRWSTAREMVRRAGLPDLPEVRPWAAPGYRYPDFLAFQQVFRLYMLPSFLSPADFHRHAAELAETLREQRVRHVELNFAPGVARVNGVPIAAAMDAIQEGFAALPGAPHLALVSGFSRDKGLEHAQSLADEAFACAGLAGIDLHGAGEAEFPPGLYRPLFERARDRGLALKAHAGEFAGPESIRGALDDLGVSRLGHAIALSLDPGLSARVRERGVVLEMCPTSNVMLGRVREARVHPARAFLAAGHRVTVNSDDPLHFCTDVTREFAVLRDELGCSDAEIAAVAHHGFAGALAADELRRRWRAEVDAWIGGGEEAPCACS